MVLIHTHSIRTLAAVVGVMVMGSLSACQSSTGQTPRASESPSSSVRTTTAQDPTSPSATSASPSPDQQGKTYKNARFGYAVTVPAAFISSGETDNGDGQIFTNEAKTVSMEISGSHNITEETAQEVHAAAQEQARTDGQTVTYQTVTNDPATGTEKSTISGYRSDGSVFYDASWVGVDRIVTMRWIYPKSLATSADQWVTATVRSLTMFDIEGPA